MEKLELITNIVKNFGVQVRIFNESSPLEEYDNGLRLRLFQHYDTNWFQVIIQSIKPRNMYFSEDIFKCHYCFFSIKDLPVESHALDTNMNNIVLIGPWINIAPTDEDINSFLQKNKIPIHLKREVILYYDHIPLISSNQPWESLLTMVTNYLYDDEIQFSITYLNEESGILSTEYNPIQDDSLSFKLIEKLYKDETAFLEAIKAGDTRQALQWIAKLSRYRPPQRVPNRMRDFKNYLLALNTLIRKTVENSSVHPFHIHTMSNDFARQIEAIERPGEIYPLCETMVRCYCSLVQQYSLDKFSSVVRDVINTVEFNLKEPLTLSILAKQFNIDPSNLSHHFTREMGMTLTDFINLKRLENACHLLAKSSLYIQEIAEECGYQDVNYFIRLFKRKYNRTPREYRNLVPGKDKPKSI